MTPMRAIIDRFCADPAFYTHLLRRAMGRVSGTNFYTRHQRARDAVNETMLVALEIAAAEEATQTRYFRNNPDAPTRWFEKVLDNIVRGGNRRERQHDRIAAAMTAWVIAEERAKHPKGTAPSVSNEDVVVSAEGAVHRREVTIRGGETVHTKRLDADSVRFPNDPPTTIRVVPTFEPPLAHVTTQEEALAEAEPDRGRPPGLPADDWDLFRLKAFGYSTAELVARTGRSSAEINRTVKKIRQRLHAVTER